MADRAAWKNYKTQMKEKRTGKKKNNSGVRILEEECIVVQRLSADVSGKAQKYTRIGAREFVSFEYDEVTVDNIKLACLNHFDVGEMVCDVVAGEQGPSCSSIKQIPDLKVIHVRFIHGSDAGAGSNVDEGDKRKRPRLALPGPSVTNSHPTPAGQQSAKESQFIPRSMSLVEMLKLGKEIKEAPTTEVQLFKFDLDQICWSKHPSVVEFVIEKDPFGTGGFRNAFKATSQAKEFQSTTWVVKKYLPQAIEDIGVTGQTIEQHTKKVVQMHSLARHFAARLKQEMEKRNKVENFGEFLKYNKIYFGKCGEECVTVEEFIAGTFTKHINNTGDVCGDITSAICKKAACLAHYSFQQSEKKLMVLDIQGCNNHLFDPEIATMEIISDGEYLFCTGNLSSNAINNFCVFHECNEYCKLLELPSLL